jgi:hypothetical protein
MDVVFKVVYRELIQHYNVMLPMLAQQTFETNGAQVVLTKSLDLFVLVQLAAFLLDSPFL